MSAPVISYTPFDECIVALRTDGFSKEADRLHHLIYKMAWTTGSELLGELGQEIKKIEKEHSKSFSANTNTKMDIAFEMVARVWPDFPR
jgi:hypothetical protein